MFDYWTEKHWKISRTSEDLTVGIPIQLINPEKNQTMAPIVRIKGGIKGDLCEIWKKINEVHLECWCEASSIDQLVAELVVRHSQFK